MMMHSAILRSPVSMMHVCRAGCFADMLTLNSNQFNVSLVERVKEQGAGLGGYLCSTCRYYCLLAPSQLTPEAIVIGALIDIYYYSSY